MDKKYKEIVQAVSLEAAEFSSEMEEELNRHEISTHYSDGSFTIEWDDIDELYEMSESKKWLLDTYGEEIKKYSHFAVNAT